jgi:aldehyde:ferredoxin oxidoreductase
MEKAMNAPGGYTGQLLRVDLGKKEVTVESLDTRDARRFIGGRGLAAKRLLDEVPAGADPLGVENKLIFGTGPATGTLVPGSSRYVVVTKSPQTNLFLDTYGGGEFPAEMKFAGYDLIVIEGRAEKPVYLWIEDDHIEVREATHLWGKLTGETETMLKQEVGDARARVATIGPAGETLRA